MMRVVALMIALAILSSACAKPSQPTLRWNGSAVEGIQFYERRMETVSVHYVLPTSPEQAETVGQALASRVEFHRKLGRLDFNTRVHIWMIPEGLNWPAGAPAPVQGRQVRAVGPGALTQAVGSPVFQVDRLRHPDATSDLPYNWAAHGLAALVTDRWGLNWPATYPRTAGEMTPEAALKWATGLDDEQAATALWQERLAYMTGTKRKSLEWRFLPEFTWVETAADMSPVRVEPKLAALPRGPGRTTTTPHTPTRSMSAMSP